MSEVKAEYKVERVAPTREYKITTEGERVYSLLRDAGYTNHQLELLAIVTKDLLKDNPFGEIHLIYAKGKAMFIRPMPSVPFE